MDIVTAGPVVHGGHALAHLDGRTLLVRGAIPGEVVAIEVTDTTRKVTRARVVEVLTASPDRVEPPCRHAGSCGGCDFQHVSVQRQREFKAAVLLESFARFARVQLAGVDVQPLPGDETGLGWRTRMRWSRGEGAWGLHEHRSARITGIDRCLLAEPSIAAPPSATVPGREAVAAVGADGRSLTVIDAEPSDSGQGGWIAQVASGRTWRLRPSSFWQVHRAAASLLSDRVRALAEPAAGEQWWDLYSGAGLFAAVLGEQVGPEGSVIAVEESPSSQREARRALHDLPQVRLVTDSVAAWLDAQEPAPGVGVVLDPPRAGAGRQVVEGLARIGARRIVYVACDPVALARDVGLLIGQGYGLRHIEAWDLFPMTQHFEVLAVLER